MCGGEYDVSIQDIVEFLCMIFSILKYPWCFLQIHPPVQAQAHLPVPQVIFDCRNHKAIVPLTVKEHSRFDVATLQC